MFDVIAGDLLSAELVSTLKRGKEHSIWGVAYLRNVIYLLSKNKQLILAFDSEVPFRMLKTIKVTQIASPRDMAACETQNCLYVVDECRKCIWKVTCTEITVNRWSTSVDNPFKISVTKGGGVLIPREGSPCVVNLMKSDARLERSIELLDEIKDIVYALQSPSETLIILYGRNRSKDR